MTDYVQYWCFVLINDVPFSSVQMVTNNLQYYDTLLQSGRPLFTVEVLLSPPEIVLHPHANELLKVMNQAMMEIVEGYASAYG